MVKIYKPTTYKPASHTHNYETDLTNKPTLGSMSSVDDAPSDDKTYGRKNGAWAEASNSVAWGSISGTLSNQTDLKNALDAKEDSITDSGWESITSASNFSGTIYARKIGKIVYLESNNMKLVSAISAGSSKSFSSLIPSAYRPDKNVYGMIATSDSTIDRVLHLVINSSGTFQIYSNPNDAVTTSMTLRFSITYMTA